jgi:hypothetical protein
MVIWAVIIRLPATSVGLQARERRGMKDYFITQNKNIFPASHVGWWIIWCIYVYISSELTIYYLILVKTIL